MRLYQMKSILLRKGSKSEESYRMEKTYLQPMHLPLVIILNIKRTQIQLKINPVKRWVKDFWIKFFSKEDELSIGKQKQCSV